MAHPEKEKIIILVSQLLDRSGLTIDQIIARMQASGCDISRSSFENHFTTRAGRKPNVPPETVLCLIDAFTTGLTNGERCPATAAIELARLTRLPLDQVKALRSYFPLAEFIAAYRDYLPTADLAPEAAIRLMTGSRPAAEIPCPYRGLHPFEEEHAQFFFGREAEIEWLLAALQRSSFLAVIGPSGSGKSSLVRAGLIPALRRGALASDPPAQAAATVAGQGQNETGTGPLIRIIEPGRRPLDALATVLAGDTGRQATGLARELAVGGLTLHQLVLEIFTSRPGPGGLVLVVDQFEELFTLCHDEAARRAFIANLLQAATQLDGRTAVILTMRADFYAQAANYPDLALYLADNQVLLSPPAGTGLEQAITGPARKVGLEFEAGLVERLLQDTAAEPGALPFLQHALLELWERRQGNTLTLAAYQSSGGVQGALAQRADLLLAELALPQQEQVRRIMLRLTRLGEDTAHTRRQAALAELARTPDEAPEIRTVVTRLADARLVTTAVNPETGEETVDIAHEALIRGWPVLQRWLTEDREALRLHQQLAEAARVWDAHQQDESYLYHGSRLVATEEWAETRMAEMNTLEQAFLSTSLAARTTQLRKREQRRERVILLLATGLALTVVLALVAYLQWRNVETERRLTLARQLAVQGRELFPDQLDLGLLLSAQAYQIADTFETRKSLLAGLQASPHLDTFLRGHNSWVWSVAFSPDGQLLASASADGTIMLWDRSTGEPVGPPLVGHNDWVRSIAFGQNGRILASGSDDGTIILWDVANREPLGPPLAAHDSFITQVAFSPDSQVLASSSADGTVKLWEVATGEQLGPPLTGHAGFVLSVAFSPSSPEGTDVQLLASSGADQTIILWDIGDYVSNVNLVSLSNLQPLAHALTGHQGPVSAVAFNPVLPASGGPVLASTSDDGTVILWDVSSRQPVGSPLRGHEGPVQQVTFSPDGQVLASAGVDGTVIVWDLATGEPQSQSLTGHTGRVLGLAFSPDAPETLASGENPRLASSSADGTIILWDISRRQPQVESIQAHELLVRTLAFHPDGKILASGSQDGSIILWDVATGQPLGPPLEGHSDALWILAFSPDGDILASGSQDQTIILWDTATGQPLGPPLKGHTEPVRTLAFSSDSRMLASGSPDQTIILWDVASRQPLGEPLTGHSAGVSSLAFSPASPQGRSGGVLASGSGNAITLWDVTTRQRLGPPLIGHSANVLSLDFSADGRTLASGGRDQSVILWDVAARQPIRQPLTGHTGTIWNILFSPKSVGSAGGEILASGSEDGTIVLWDIVTHRPLGQPLETNDMVWSLAYRPVNAGDKDDPVDLLAAGHTDGTISLWDVGPESWQRRICQMVDRNLTLEEWARYLGNEPYQPTCPSAPPPSAGNRFESNPPQSETFPAAGSRNPSDPGPISAAIVEEFESDQGFIQTSPDVHISGGQVLWHYKRNGGVQYVYRSITPFAGNVRLVMRGQVDSWTSNCIVYAGVGDSLGSGAAVSIGYTGGGCETNGPYMDGLGINLLDRQAGDCQFTGNWLWIEGGRSYTTTLELRDGVATLAVDGVGISTGEVTYEGPYTTLYVGNNGNGDWPECAGKIDSLRIEPLR